MDDIGAAAGVTGPAIYRYFDSKAAVLAEVFDDILDAVDPTDPVTGAPSPDAVDLTQRIGRYASAVAGRRELMGVFVREVHHLPPEHAHRLRMRQRDLVAQWRALLASVHPDWGVEQVRTAIHAVFGMLNSVGTFTSRLSDADLAAQLSALAGTALALPASTDAAPPGQQPVQLPDQQRAPAAGSSRPIR